METVAALYNYWIAIILMMIGFYIVIARDNLVKKMVGLGVFQASVFLMYITMGKADGGTVPVIPLDTVNAVADGLATVDGVYSNPLPHVLILTAIVVGVATLALGLALVVRIREEYGSTEEDEILAIDAATEAEEEAAEKRA